MAERSNIEWCDATFNPWIGCTKVSPACDHCYAERGFDLRRHVVQWGAGQARKRTSPANWKLPLQWNAKPLYECEVCGLRTDNPMRAQCKGPHRSQHMWKPARRRVFCASLADVFDNEVPVQWRQDLFDLIRRCENLDFLLLTKRIGNVRSMAPVSWLGGPVQHGPDPCNIHGGWPANVWLGATICNQDEADRDIPKLLSTPAAVRFVSIEPMLERIDLSFAMPWRTVENGLLNRSIDWVICGGESGPHARPMHPDWARSLRDQCAIARVPFLFKQWGEWTPGENVAKRTGVAQSATWFDGKWLIGTEDLSIEDGHIDNEPDLYRVGRKTAGRLLDGCTHDGFPEVRPCVR